MRPVRSGPTELGSTGAFALYAYAGVVLAVSAGRAAGYLPLGPFAASPSKVADGRLWVLLTSALVVDRPVVVSLLAFFALAAATLRICGARIAWAAALAGHVLATLIVYGAIALVQLGQPIAFSDALRSADYGVSAISAAWLGALATVLWRSRRRGRGGRAAIAASCVAVGVVAYSVHPSHGVLASEHVFAFIVGVLAAAPGLRRRLLAATMRLLWRRPLLQRLDPLLAATVMAITVLIPFVVAPTAVANFVWFVENRPPTAHRCLTVWNWSWQAPHSRLSRAHAAYAVVQAQERSRGGRRRSGCTLVFYGSSRTVAVSGRWSHGLVIDWQVRSKAMIPQQPANATVSIDDHLRPRRTGPHR